MTHIVFHQHGDKAAVQQHHEFVHCVSIALLRSFLLASYWDQGDTCAK